MSFHDLAEARHSVRHYQPGLSIDDATLQAIFADVLLSPSSFNLQHWQFVVVRDAARKQALRAVSYGQQQVEDCAAAILVCGRLNAFDDAPRIYEGAPEALRAKGFSGWSGKFFFIYAPSGASSIERRKFRGLWPRCSSYC